MASVATANHFSSTCPAKIGIGEVEVGKFAIFNLHLDGGNKVAKVTDAFIGQRALAAAKFNGRLNIDAIIARA